MSDVEIKTGRIVGINSQKCEIKFIKTEELSNAKIVTRSEGW